MRAAISGGGSTVFGGTPSTRCTGQSRGLTAIRSTLRTPSGRTTVTSTGPVSSRPTPNTTVP